MEKVNENRIKDHFTSSMFYKLFYPAMFSSFGWALSDMADAVVLGQRLGTVGLAAISFILPVYMIESALAHSFGLGGSIRFSLLMSKGKKKQANNNFVSVISLSIIISLIIAIAGVIFYKPILRILGAKASINAELYNATRDYFLIRIATTPLFQLSNILNYYLRNDNNEKIAAAGSMAGNISDILLNLLLVFVFDMGTAGAAAATALGETAAIIIYLPGVISKKHSLTLHMPEKGFAKDALSCLRDGFSTAVQYIYQLVFFLICNHALMRTGGESAVAIFDVLQNVSYLILYLYQGTARAMQPILSTYTGECSRRGRRDVIKIGFRAGIIAGSVIIAAIELFPNAVSAVFGITDAETTAKTAIALRIYCVGAFFAGLNILFSNLNLSCGQDKTAFAIETGRGFVFLLTSTLALSPFGLPYFWLLFPITEIAALITYVIIRKFPRYALPDIDEERVMQKTIYGDAEDIVAASVEAEKFCEKWEAGPAQQYIVTMVIEELGVAILNNCMAGLDEKYLQITLVALKDNEFEIHIRDNGAPFDPFSLQTEKAGNDNDFEMDAMGILMIRNKAKDFSYRHYQGFNTLIVRV